MAVSIKEVYNIIDNAVDSDLILKIEDKIDKSLSDPKFLKDWRCGTPEAGHFYRFAIEGELNKASKEALSEKYLNGGWAKVEIINSSENGERPGGALVILTMPPSA